MVESLVDYDIAEGRNADFRSALVDVERLLEEQDASGEDGFVALDEEEQRSRSTSRIFARMKEYVPGGIDSPG